MDSIESFEAGDNCVSYFQTEGMSEEQATTFCSGEQAYGHTLKEYLNKGYVNLEELKTNNVIKNVVISSSEIAITDYNIDIGGIDVVIPSTIDGKTVVAIGDNAFYAKALSTETSMLNKSNIQFMSNKEDREIASVYHGNIKSVVIPSTVKSIGHEAFAYNQLTSIIIPDSVTNIGSSAFYKDSYSNPNLTKIVNKTGNSFNWGNIINNTSGYEFIAGTVETGFGNVEVTSE